MANNYEDIINKEYKPSNKRPHMSRLDRAAQFSPFAALTGFGDAVNEVGRLTDYEITLEEDQYNALNQKINMLQSKKIDSDNVKIVYFVPDEKKSGGKYKEIIGKIKKIDEYDRKIVMSNGLIISMNDITDITVGFEIT